MKMFLNEYLEYNERCTVGRTVHIELYWLYWTTLQNKQGDSMWSEKGNTNAAYLKFKPAGAALLAV